MTPEEHAEDESDVIERLQYELKMATIRAEHAESDIGGVREEQWYEVRNRELEAEVERLYANRLATARHTAILMKLEAARVLRDLDSHIATGYVQFIVEIDAEAIARRAVDSEVGVDHNEPNVDE